MFDSCHYNDIQQKAFPCHLIAFSTLCFVLQVLSSIWQVPSVSKYFISTLAYIPFIPKIKMAYHNYKIAFMSSLLTLWQQLESLNDYLQILLRYSLGDVAEWVRHQTKKQKFAGLYPTQVPLLLHIKTQIENTNHIDSIRYWSIHRYVFIISMYWPNLSTNPPL